MHNVAGEKNYEAYKLEEFEDAHLTPEGDAQCEAFIEKYSQNTVETSADLLVVSPMRRTLSTATQCFPELVGKVRWLAHEMIREMAGGHPCDRRRPISEHRESYPHVDFAQVENNEDPLYYLTGGDRETEESVTARAHVFFKWLETRSEKEIVVVTHSAFLRNIFNTVLQVNLDHEEKRCGVFRNCEMKSYHILFENNSAPVFH